MIRYKYYQPNKLDYKDEENDCVIRGLTKFLGKTWVETFDIVCKIARENQKMPNSLAIVEQLMKIMGISKVSEYKPRAKNKVTVSSFCKEHNVGVYLLYVRAGFGTHIVCVENGYYFDTWDCGDRLVYASWKKV